MSALPSYAADRALAKIGPGQFMKQSPRVTDPFFGFTQMTQAETAEILKISDHAAWLREKKAFTKLRKAFETEIGKEE